MDRKLGGLIAIALFATPAVALGGDPYAAGRALGEAMTGSSARDQAIYDEQYLRTVDAYLAIEQAKQARYEADLTELENTLRAQLKDAWTTIGVEARGGGEPGKRIPIDC